MRTHFSPKDVVRVTGISYRQIQYWDSSGFIRPSARRGGRYRAYTFGDLVRLQVARELRSRGVSIQKLRSVIQSLDRLMERTPGSLEGLTLLIDGESILVFTGEVIMDGDTQRGFYQFKVSELEARVREVFPEPGGEAVVAARSRAG